MRTGVSGGPPTPPRAWLQRHFLWWPVRHSESCDSHRSRCTQRQQVTSAEGESHSESRESHGSRCTPRPPAPSERCEGERPYGEGGDSQGARGPSERWSRRADLENRGGGLSALGALPRHKGSPGGPWQWAMSHGHRRCCRGACGGTRLLPRAARGRRRSRRRPGGKGRQYVAGAPNGPCTTRPVLRRQAVEAPVRPPRLQASPRR